MKIILTTFLLLNVVAVPAFARVFNLTRETFASYLVGNYGQSNLHTSPFYGEHAGVETYTSKYSTTLAGEFGFVYYNGIIGWRFGFEAIKPLPVEGAARSGSTDLYTYSNQVTVITPKIGMDLMVYNIDWFRASIFGFFGQAGYTSKTDYTNVTVSPSTNHSVEQRSTANTYGAGVVTEYSFFDTTTFVLEVGYRQLKFTNVKYASDVTTFTGTVSKGDEVRNADGSAHEVDFTGAFVGAGLRVYLF